LFAGARDGACCLPRRAQSEQNQRGFGTHLAAVDARAVLRLAARTNKLLTVVCVNLLAVPATQTRAAARGTITPFVTNAAGQPIQDAKITLFGTADREARAGRAFCDTRSRTVGSVHAARCPRRPYTFVDVTYDHLTASGMSLIRVY
jgi:hypothetical protein